MWERGVFPTFIGNLARYQPNKPAHPKCAGFCFSRGLFISTYGNFPVLYYQYDVLKAQAVLSDQLTYYHRTLSKKYLLSNYKFRGLFRYGVFTTMASRRRNSAVSWINVKLSSDDKDHLKNHNPEPAEMLEAIDALVLNGYSFNIKCQSDDTVIAMVFRTATDDENTTLGCSAFANELEFALHVLLYKLLVRLDGQWTRELSDTDSGSGESFG